MPDFASRGAQRRRRQRAGPCVWRQRGRRIVVTAAPDPTWRSRFPNGSFHIAPRAGTQFERVGGDELLFVDGRSRSSRIYVSSPRRRASVELRIRGTSVIRKPPPHRCLPRRRERIIPTLSVTAAGRRARCSGRSRAHRGHRPWFTHNALVHYLSPRGLEQYSGGGWGTRDVCQGRSSCCWRSAASQPMRDLLLRVMRQQNPDGDWPQWFMFFEREREHPPRRLARRHRVLAAAGARAVPDRVRRWRRARRARAVLRCAWPDAGEAPPSGSTPSARSR